MLKIQHILLRGFMVFAAFGMGILLGHLEYTDVQSLRADVIASTPDAGTTNSGTIDSATADVVGMSVAPLPAPLVVAPKDAPTLVAPVPIVGEVDVPVVLKDVPVVVSDATVPEVSGLVVAPDTKVIEDKIEEIQEIKKIEKSSTVDIKEMEDSPIVENKKTEKLPVVENKKMEESPIVEIKKTDESSVIEIKTQEGDPVTAKIPEESLEKPTPPEEKPKVQVTSTQPLILPQVTYPSSNQPSSLSDDEIKMIIQNAKQQPKINKKILDAIGALRTIPDLLTQFFHTGTGTSDEDSGVEDSGDEAKSSKDASRDDTHDEDSDNDADTSKDTDGSKEHDSVSEHFLKIMTNIIKGLTANLQQNTEVLESTLDYIYKQQGTNISHGRCIATTYFTYSDAENACVMIARKVCAANDIIPDNRYNDMESCQRDNSLLQVDESREVKAFKRQKEEYLRRLTSLQQTYKYYSVRWEELVDLVKDSENFDALGAAGNAVNAYRTEQIAIEEKEQEKIKENVEEKVEEKEQEKVETKVSKKVETQLSDAQASAASDPEEKVSTPVRTKLRPLPAAAID